MKVTLEFKDNSPDFLRQNRDAALDGLFIAADETTGDIKGHIQRDAPTGKVYHRHNPERVHRASAPGQYPATDLGTLINSLGVERDNEAVYIITTARHGAELEFRQSAGRRPYLSRGVLENQERIGEITTNYVKRFGSGG